MSLNNGAPGPAQVNLYYVVVVVFPFTNKEERDGFQSGYQLIPTKDKGAGTGGENINAEAIGAVGNRDIDIKLRTSRRGALEPF